MKREIFGKGSKMIGEVPAVALMNPKHPRNVGQAVRACSCFGIKQCWFSGDRIRKGMEDKKRLPREERMKGYSEVDIIQYDYIFDQFPNAVPVGVEVMPGAELLPHFEHPKNALYVFGPEDGSLPSSAKRFCHKFVFIPMRHCANLSASLYIILYDRLIKEYINGTVNAQAVEDVLAESRGWTRFEEEVYTDIDNKCKKITLDEMLK